ncbi:fimbrial protein [Enterobacter sp. ENT03]|uniref:fimbrial protein n=1 Tax=Enterobacter sp. ENT03 TaxID=2854780 RepID=UPI001C48963A|nr:fimbrial protein [Enterobacter sp. ENT03]MBV7406162.1 fimbrial protein [Enterobacter sp. ENT03]
MSAIKIFARIVSGLLLWGLAAGLCGAACTSSPATPQMINPGTIVVPAWTQPGNDVLNAEHSLSFSGQCDGNSGEQPGDTVIACFVGSGAEVSGYPGVYATGIDGTGIALATGAGVRIRGSGSGCDSRATPLATLDSSLAFTYSVTLSLVKTASLVGSGILQESQTRFAMAVYQKAGIGGASPFVSYVGEMQVRPASCDLLTKDVNVSLGRYTLQDFSSTQRGGVTKNIPFSIDLECDEGAKVTLVVDGTRDSAVSGVLAVIGGEDGTGAGGVGVQVLNGAGYPFYLGYQNVIEPQTHQGTVQIPFNARYYLTGRPFTAGPANALATFTLTYQ